MRYPLPCSVCSAIRSTSSSTCWPNCWFSPVYLPCGIRVDVRRIPGAEPAAAAKFIRHPYPRRAHRVGRRIPLVRRARVYNSWPKCWLSAPDAVRATVIRMGTRNPSASETFHVSVHDVEPTRIDEIETVLESLRPLVGRSLSVAVVPCWHGRPLSAADARFLAAVRGVREVLQHGWTHRREGRAGLVSAVTGRADEFAPLSRSEAWSRLDRGRRLLEDLLGRPVAGFVAPAFQRGRVDALVAARAGLSFLVGWSRMDLPGKPPIPLATTLWDLSPHQRLDRLGELGGRVAALRRAALPVVAIHPVDVGRGALPRALALVRSFLDAGRKPVLLKSLVDARRGAP